MSCELLVTLQGSCIWTAKTGLLVHHIQHLIQFYLHIQSIPISACFAAIVCLKTVKQIFSEPHMQFLVCIDGQGRSQIFELQLHVINGNSQWATKQGVIPTLGIKWKAICWQNNVDEDCKNIQSIRRFAAPSSQNSWHVLPLRRGCEWQQPLWQADEWLLLCF